MSHNVKVIGPDQAVDGGGLVNQLVIAGPCRLYSISVYNTNAADRYFMVFDLAALPADATVPKIPPIKVFADSQGGWDFGDGRVFSQGVVVCNSTTNSAKTIGAADAFISAAFRKTE